MEAKIGLVFRAGEAAKMPSFPSIHHPAYIIITVRDLDLILRSTSWQSAECPSMSCGRGYRNCRNRRRSSSSSSSQVLTRSSYGFLTVAAAGLDSWFDVEESKVGLCLGYRVPPLLCSLLCLLVDFIQIITLEILRIALRVFNTLLNLLLPPGLQEEYA